MFKLYISYYVNVLVSSRRS